MLKANRRFGGIYHLRIQVRGMRQARNKCEAGNRQSSVQMEATCFTEMSVDFIATALRTFGPTPNNLLLDSNILHRRACRNDTASDLNAGEARFESRSGHRLS
jgi:hypothetical protein